MMRNIALLAVTAVIALQACRGGSEPTPPPDLPVTLTISVPTLSLIVGDEGQLNAWALDSRNRVLRATFEWSSSDPNVATVGEHDGAVTAISAGSTTVTVVTGALRASAIVSVRPPDPPIGVSLSPPSLFLVVGDAERLTARAYDLAGRTISVPFVWSSADPAIATVDSTDGIVRAIAAGVTTVTATAGALSATAAISVEPDTLVSQGAVGQWAISATASTEYTPYDWSAMQATGAPNSGCGDDPNAWASFLPDSEDWLELTYARPVLPSEIRIYELWAPGSISKVEVKDGSGHYHTVYTNVPTVDPQPCPRLLTIPITGVMVYVSTVRVTIDQRVKQDWNEIDAVRLIGRP